FCPHDGFDPPCTGPSASTRTIHPEFKSVHRLKIDLKFLAFILLLQRARCPENPVVSPHFKSERGLWITLTCQAFICWDCCLTVKGSEPAIQSKCDTTVTIWLSGHVDAVRRVNPVQFHRIGDSLRCL